MSDSAKPRRGSPARNSLGEKAWLTDPPAPTRRRWIVVADSLGHWRWTGIGVALVVLFGSIDATLSTEVTTAFFYLIPVCLVGWFAGLPSGLAVSLLSAITWLIAEHLAGISWSHWLIGAWNTASRLGFFVLITWLLTTLRETLRQTLAFSRTDYLTGALNGRWLAQLAGQEIYRAARYGHSLSLAYIDLDGFKIVNDTRGHARGDALLCEVVDFIGQRLRRSDLMARVGGDEFVCLLTETDERGACEVMDRIRASLADAMQRQGLPVTMSIGIVATADATVTTDQLLSKADELMYSVKHGGKNGIASATIQTAA